MPPERTQKDRISYIVSEGSVNFATPHSSYSTSEPSQRGRNPGVSKELKKLREWGNLSHISDVRTCKFLTVYSMITTYSSAVRSATSSDEYAPMDSARGSRERNAWWTLNAAPRGALNSCRWYVVWYFVRVRGAELRIT